MTEYGEITAGLQNTYFAMRHGLSVPNVERKIVSDPRNGTLDVYGLVPVGFLQVEESARASNLPPDTVIFTSPFSRARQTAKVLQEVLGAAEPTVDARLRERHFGDMELESSDLYKEVWARDAQSATHTYRGVESLCHLAERELSAIADLERKFAKRVIVLVGHADPLNVLKAAVSGRSLRTHRKAFSIANAEMQPLPTAQIR